MSAGFWILTAILAVTAGALALVWRRLERHSRARELLDSDADDRPPAGADPGSLSWLGRRLYLAGYRSPNAPVVFGLATAAMLVAGGLIVVFLYSQGAFRLLELLLVRLPGGVGEIFLPLAWSAPVFILVAFGALPALVVRARRRRRVRQFEQDLPITLDLLATLVEAGLGFDSAVDRFLATQASARPLSTELQSYQTEVTGGRFRIDALRRLGQRVDVMWFTIFISAVVQAERLGSSLATTLRTQADDLRSRRRERAMGMAMALPSKLVVPLVVCFLPGIMVFVLGPPFLQMLGIVDQMFRQGQG